MPENTMRTMGVSAKQLENARQVFRRSAEQAGFFGAGKDRLLAPAALTLAESSVQSEGISNGGGDTDTVTQLTMRIEALEKENESLRRQKGTAAVPDLPAAISGVLHTLPLSPSEVWTAEDLDDWADMFKRVVKRTFKDRMAPQASPKS